MKLFHKHLERNKRETEENILYIDYNTCIWLFLYIHMTLEEMFVQCIIITEGNQCVNTPNYNTQCLHSIATMSVYKVTIINTL